MKTLKIKFFTLLLAVPFVVLLDSCKKEDSSNTNSTSESTVTEESLTMPGLQMMEDPQIQAATEDSEFAIIDDGMPKYLGDSAGFHHPRKDFKGMPPRKGMPPHKRCDRKCGMDSLGLSDTQKKALHMAMMEKHRCAKGTFMKLRQYNLNIIARGNQMRKDLMEKYRNGDITKEDLRKKLDALNQKIKQTLRDDASRKRAIESLKACHKTFIQKVKRILDETQWKKWVAFHKKCLDHKCHRPCK